VDATQMAVHGCVPTPTTACMAPQQGCSLLHSTMHGISQCAMPQGILLPLLLLLRQRHTTPLLLLRLSLLHATPLLLFRPFKNLLELPLKSCCTPKI
jgi:hypothetical protein